MTGRALELGVSWLRLDVPGAETAWLWRLRDGWELAGTVVVAAGGVPAALEYVVACTDDWRTRAGRVWGRVGPEPVELAVERRGADWFLNGAGVAGLTAAVDLDLAFTPATNLLPIRRLRLAPGSAERVVSAWLRYPGLDLVPLAQTYARVSEEEVRYSSPSHGLTTSLRLHPSGFPREYPGLWRLVAATS